MVCGHGRQGPAGEEPEAQVLPTPPLGARAPGIDHGPGSGRAGRRLSPTLTARGTLQIRRLAKAARHAGELARLAEQAATARTAVEAGAYAAFMAGVWLSEKGTDWPAALAKLQRSQCARPGDQWCSVRAWRLLGKARCVS